MVATGQARLWHRTGTTRGPIAVSVALGLGLAGLALAVPRATAAGDDVRVPLPGAMAARTVVAASGRSMLLALGDSAAPDKVTRDNGATFATLGTPVPANARVAHVGNGKVVWEVVGESSTRLSVYDFATATTRTHEVAGGWVETTDSTTAIYSRDATQGPRFSAQDLATGVSHPLAHTASGEVESSVTTFHLDDGDVALASTTSTGEDDHAADGYLDLLPLNGEPSPLAAPERVPGLVAAALREDQAVYVTAAVDTFSVCFREIDNWSDPACRTFGVRGLDDPRTATADLALGADWALITPRWGAGSEAHIVVAGTTAAEPPVEVREPEADRVRIFAAGDSERPLAAVWTGTSGQIGQVGRDGRVSTLFDYPTGPAQVVGLRLTPDRLTGLDRRPGLESSYQAWQRSVSETAIGGERQLTPIVADVGASGARTLLDGAKLQLSDRGKAVRTVARPKYGANARSLSGPYFSGRTVAYDQITRVDGKVMNNSQVRGLYGSLALRLASASLNRYEVVDVATKAVKRVVVPSRLEPRKFTGHGIWGDLVLGWVPLGAEEIPTTVVVNYRTGESWDRVGYPFGIGDGFVVIQLPAGDPENPYDDQLAAWNLQTGENTVMPDLDWWEVTTDGTKRLAYNTYSELVVRELHGVGRSAPRVLGTVAPENLNIVTRARQWRLEVDATKPLAAGRLTITSAAGTVVWSQAVAASPDGSVRDIAWDGRKGTLDVAPGTYRWSLEQAAADGSGSLVAIDGSSPVAGSIQVVKVPLGTVTGTTPKITDTTPKVGQSLAVDAGKWSPTTGLERVYAWYRQGSSAVIGTGSTYTVTAADLGKKLRVSVTGAVDGWTSSRKTSAYTSAVAKGTLSRGTPDIGNNAPKVGDVLTISEGTWRPQGVTFSYSWYRVSSKGKVSSLKKSGTTYTVPAAVAGYRVKVKVTGRLKGYTTSSKYSALTGKVLKS